MSTNTNTGVREAEQWRARILRALAELRHQEDARGARGEPSSSRERHEADSEADRA